METPVPRTEIRPQPGPQEAFLSTPVDIAFYGGAAGGGKTFSLLIEPLRHISNPRFGGVIFRRNATQIRNEGGLWDESVSVYGGLGADPRESYLEWTFPSGFRMKFAHLELEVTVLNWQGAQVPYMGFDELTHFTEKQFTYMLSRNRSTSGVPGYVRGTCNPDVDSWVRKWIDWYIGEDGFPIKERAGKIRWFVRIGDEMHWANTREELLERFGKDELPKSFTFIPSKVSDNKILLAKDPTYLANLKALSRVDRERLLDGNWNVRPSAGMFFRREWFQVVDAIPGTVVRWVRSWDKAATKPNEENKDPDWTAGVKMGRLADGRFIVADVRRDRTTPLGVERLVKNTASQDGQTVTVTVPQDPGSAGKADAENYVRLLAGYIVVVTKPSNDKVTRAKPYSAQVENGNVLLLRGAWNEAYLTELENFDGSDKGHDDQVDGSSDAFNELCGNLSILNVL